MLEAKFSVINGSCNLPDALKNAVVAIGNFDGVHLGHQYLLSCALKQARETNCPALVLSFEPHPRDFFNSKPVIDKLSLTIQKYELFELLGFDAVIEQNFNREFSELDCEEFIEQILLCDLGAKFVVVGQDFRFGAMRNGNCLLLQDYAAKSGAFKLIAVPPQKTQGGQVISSSYIRFLLKEGKVKEAADLLGYHYKVREQVIHGAKLGRKIGFPTINMSIDRQIKLPYGVYAVKFRRDNGELLDGVASFGLRPTVVDKGEALLETHLFDFNQEIYGEYGTVIFFEYLRAEVKFCSLEDMIEQIKLDSIKSKEILANLRPISELDQKLCF